MNKHTAQSLKWYLERDVYCKGKFYQSDEEGDVSFEGKYKMIDINSEEDLLGIIDDNDEYLTIKTISVYPILKTSDELSEDDKIYILEDDKSSSVIPYFMIWNCHYLSPKKLNRLIEKGYGAISCKKSPTGYSDLFGMPCVTPKMVAEGF